MGKYSDIPIFNAEITSYIFCHWTKDRRSNLCETKNHWRAHHFNIPPMISTVNIYLITIRNFQITLQSPLHVRRRNHRIHLRNQTNTEIRIHRTGYEKRYYWVLQYPCRQSTVVHWYCHRKTVRKWPEHLLFPKEFVQKHDRLHWYAKIFCHVKKYTDGF